MSERKKYRKKEKETERKKDRETKRQKGLKKERKKKVGYKKDRERISVCLWERQNVYLVKYRGKKLIKTMREEKRERGVVG